VDVTRGTIAGGDAAARGGGSLTLWLDAPGGVREQMARDAALLAQAVAAPDPGTLLRLYTFAPPGITLGRAQDPGRELDLAALARDGVAHAVRPTGGRAIWHDEEWTFALVTRLGAGGWAPTPAAAYARTAELLATALRSLGVPVTLAPGTRRGPGAPRDRHGAAPPCFASTARHELLLHGRKLAGIAQRVVRGGLLQQGSILLGDSHARLARYAAVADHARAALAARWRGEAAPAGASLAGGRDIAQLLAALVGALPQASIARGGTPLAWPR
jgi:lipoate-protein ligase A